MIAWLTAVAAAVGDLGAMLAALLNLAYQKAVDEMDDGDDDDDNGDAAAAAVAVRRLSVRVERHGAG